MIYKKLYYCFIKIINSEPNSLYIKHNCYYKKYNIKTIFSINKILYIEYYPNITIIMKPIDNFYKIIENIDRINFIYKYGSHIGITRNELSCQIILYFFPY
jgi:hypothetical protein